MEASSSFCCKNLFPVEHLDVALIKTLQSGETKQGHPHYASTREELSSQVQYFISETERPTKMPRIPLNCL